MRRIYLLGVSSALEEVKWNVNGDVFWSKEKDGECKSIVGFVQQFF